MIIVDSKQAKKLELDRKTLELRRASKFFIPALTPAHNWLRNKSKIYYNLHWYFQRGRTDLGDLFFFFMMIVVII
ncbi:MAG: hypothetical protein CEN89_582 [Candidatus Berkelbacteria bacterium Licking1014_7]|uniref:Uncharacterized protein n=1 Tax=Candidatus Berkelbacteria bacterium Licking1014_7 TaxID=2017147 RepID=A0A554LIG6_9BACT|nr:MAG: hypothetical protein CEN89_582 [Candidatus Berkelbacteria bacterium Licking1014_7]